MASQEKSAPSYELPHLRVDDFVSENLYGQPPRGISGAAAKRDRTIHGPKLEAQLAAALAQMKITEALRDPKAQHGKPGLYLQVESAQGAKLPDLNWKSQDIRVGAVKVTDAGTEMAALFVPDKARGFLATKVREYAQDNTKKGDPRHEDKFGPLENFAAGTLGSLWTDTRAVPTPSNTRYWWECWCWKDRTPNLLAAAADLTLRVSEARQLHFPDFDVIPVYATNEEIERLLQRCDAIEELRLASDTPSFFACADRAEQDLWVDDLAARLVVNPDAAAVCILDGGVQRAHPLLVASLDEVDCLTVDPAWGVDDHHPDGHGTNMAGNALLGDLTHPLSHGQPVELGVRLEAVKFLPPPGASANEPSAYGSITQSAISLPEINKPDRKRVYCMAVTNEDVSGERPTSWSAAIDQACSGSMPGDDQSNDARRLFFVSAGNIPDASDPNEISDADEFPIEDPAQAWNAVAVGGFTDKCTLTPEDKLPGWAALAAAGDLSPYSRISTDWEHSRTPIKPEIVFEAGNRAINNDGTEVVAGAPSLSLLTTAKDFLKQPITTFWATSPAAAQGAGMAAQLMTHNPDLWPETVRALMVHSAAWTPAMRARIAACGGKRERVMMARHFGYGVPNLERALASAENDLALLAEATIQPFHRPEIIKDNGKKALGDVTFKDAHYYDLPWPKSALEALNDKDVSLKVTLSYFIEPSPGEIAPVTPALYQSHGLRFDLKRASETGQDFRKRINRLEREEDDERSAAPSDPRWVFGSKSVAAGSLHCDVWVGPAIELASRSQIAIYPVSGWWRYRPQRKRYNSMTRYALAISITSAEQDVELYTEISNLIGVSTPIKI